MDQRTLLLLAALAVAAVHSIPIENGVEGEPEIECGATAITVNFNTQKSFQGHVYVKGRFNEADLAVMVVDAQQQPTMTTCYLCASAELEQYWELTGLVRPSGIVFSQQCDNINALSALSQALPCNGPCMTMIVQHPDFSLLNTGNKFIVRGCHAKLTGAVAQVDLSRGSYCEYDNSFRRPDSSGTFRDTKVLVEFCSGMACNTRSQYPAPDDITGPPCIGSNQYGVNNNNFNNNYYNNSNNNNADRSCYECSSQNIDCYSGRCIGKKYCYKNVVQVDYVIQYYKTCADFNTYGTQTACGSFPATASVPANAVLQGTATQCFCNDQTYCNGVASVSFSSLMYFFLNVVALSFYRSLF
uniref:Cuticlin N-terminal domain-containing protein n=1 Tax=Plectus sambesii TaxID=2011161 RepID=A0A914WWP4_9BILA